MSRGFALASTLAAVAHAFAPAPIQWGAIAGKTFVMEPTSFCNGAPTLAVPVALTIRGQHGRKKQCEDSRFTANPDGTIAWDATRMCIEARGDKRGNTVQMNHCNGGPKQLWDLVIMDNKEEFQIQLKETNMCIDVDSRDEVRAHQVELHECDDQATKLWSFQKLAQPQAPSPFLHPELSSQMRYGVVFVLSMIIPSVLSIGALVWRWRQTARMVAMRQAGRGECIHQGGIHMTESLAMQGESMASIQGCNMQNLIPAVMATNAESLPGSKGIFFDVDATLSDSSQLGLDATNAVLQKAGLRPDNPVSEAEYKEGSQYITPRRFSFHITGDPDEGGRVPLQGPSLGEAFDTMYVEMVDLQTAGFFAGIPEMLDSIKSEHGEKVRFAALSNAAGAYCRAVMKANNFDEREIPNDDGVSQRKKFFEVQLGADDVPKPKPNPDGLLQMCGDLGLAASDCVYVGDSPTDGQAARAAGMKSIAVIFDGVRDKVQLSKDFDIVVDTVEGLRGALDEFMHKG